MSKQGRAAHRHTADRELQASLGGLGDGLLGGLALAAAAHACWVFSLLRERVWRLRVQETAREERAFVSGWCGRAVLYCVFLPEVWDYHDFRAG